MSRKPAMQTPLAPSGAPSGATIDTIPAPAGLTEVELTGDEGTSLCPLTEQPDWWHVTITYAPQALLLESKSLKLYLQRYREQAIFCEQLAVTICRDVVAACAPVRCTVRVAKKARGGVAITATSQWPPVAHPA